MVTYKILIIFTASTAASNSMNCGERYMLRSDKANICFTRLFKRTKLCGNSHLNSLSCLLCVIVPFQHMHFQYFIDYVLCTPQCQQWGYKVKCFFRSLRSRNNFVPHFKNYGAASACILLCYEYFNGNLYIVLHPRRTDPPMRTPSAV